MAHLSRFVEAGANPTGLRALFDRDPAALSVLVQLFATSDHLADRLVADPETFDLVSAREDQPIQRSELIAEICHQLSAVDQPKRAAMLIRRFYSRHVMRIAYGEFIRNVSPEAVGRQLSDVADAILEGGLQFSLKRLADRRGMPERPDGSIPKVTVIALGSLGGQELSYASPMQVVFLYDAIDHKNIWHRKFYDALVGDIVNLLCGDARKTDGVDIDLRQGPRYEVGVPICGYREAARIYETSGRTWQRLSFVKSRVAAGSASLGKLFLDRLEPWVYRQFITRVERAEIRSLRQKLSQRVESFNDTSRGANAIDVVQSPGGRADLELTVQFLQLVHGGHDRSVRKRNIYDSINRLHRGNYVTDDDRQMLADHYARLSRLHHLLTIPFDRRRATIPDDAVGRSRLAWLLGIRKPGDGGDASGGVNDNLGVNGNLGVNESVGDAQRFERMLASTLADNRDLIGRLLVRSLGDDPIEGGKELPPETTLVLDPDPDPAVAESLLHRYQLMHPRSAMADLASLATETVPFLSPLRCRHVFASIAPTLLDEIARTPDPDGTLRSMVRVTDSLGAKATLWELLGGSRPTMKLMVRLGATTPYLVDILTNNPGMIDELIDSLLINRLPSADRLDAHSIELCKGVADIDDILHSFKSSAHLMIGVRDMLGKESLEATHQAIGDTAEACLRRVIEHEQELVAGQFGDPVNDQGQPVEMVALALGKLGGREPNYHSDLDVIFLFSDSGETRRRVGGHRRTTTNDRFFNLVARQTFARINRDDGPNGRLYELDSRLRPLAETGPMAVTIGQFLQQFDHEAAPLWMRLALCKARAISGSRRLRTQTNARVVQTIADGRWHPTMAAQIRELRLQLETNASPDNLKRGHGGTIDVEHVSQMLTMRHAAADASIIRQGTTASLDALADAGFLSMQAADTLIAGYRTLRRTEASLRLMNSPARHALPRDDEAMRNLAFLMGEPDGEAIVQKCEQARRANREIFDQVFDSAIKS